MQKNIKVSHDTEHDDERGAGRIGEKDIRRSGRNTGKIRETVMRLTRKNPDGKTYRLPCTEQTPGIRVDHRMGYPTLSGAMIDRIGRMEDVKPLTEWEKDIKNSFPLQREATQPDGCQKYT